MKAIRWIGIGLVILMAAIARLAVVARFSHGPVGQLQGGPLVAGRLVEGDRYRVDLTRVEDEDVQRALREKLRGKYPEGAAYSGEVWYFELAAPARTGG